MLVLVKHAAGGVSGALILISFRSFSTKCTRPITTVVNYGLYHCYPLTLGYPCLFTNTNTNTNNRILHRIKNNETLAISYFSMVDIYNIIQHFYNKHYAYHINILDRPMTPCMELYQTWGMKWSDHKDYFV